MPSSSVSVIVVSYNTREKLRRCLRCVEPEHELIVVDNNSSDGSAAMVESEFPHAMLISPGRNLGFGKGNNLGMEAATRPLLLLLNSDCYAAPGAISSLAEVLDNPKIVVAGGKLLNPDGSLQESVAGQLKLKSVFLEQTYLDNIVRRINPKWSYWRTGWALREATKGGNVEVPQVTGACLMMRPLERFDERFFLYCEDTELCHRLSRHGKIVYAPNAVFTHDLGSSSIDDRWRSIARYNWGKELYFRIHHGQLQSLACLGLDRLGALLRMVVWTLAFRPAKVRMFWRVLSCPLSGPNGS